ncbi:F-box only protein 40-like [Xiphias gladius]|uniref:F-box only protein 40-like n=1 Tax=Xiphias gladius TaxID=8245 RepID=UPI001A98F7A6|nr:F-box only protein 40-like [Xiphias gladius]
MVWVTSPLSHQEISLTFLPLVHIVVLLTIDFNLCREQSETGITKRLIQSPVGMSHRSRASKVRQHVHCDSCYSRRCRARVEVSVCCSVIPCRLHCGALFHLCKEEDHLLLCPNVRVPCLNAGYGCPVHMPRSSRAAHLQVCPASVVCCSMEWLRWPTDDTNPHSDMALKENVLRENEGQEEALDLAMALVDQSDLYGRLKMKPLYPELMEEEEEEELKEEEKEEMAMGGFVSGVIINDANKENSSCENDVEETVQNSVGQGLVLSKEKYNLSEMMFGMERGGCAVAQANVDNPKPKPKSGEKGEAQNTQKDGENCPPPNTSKTGHAPWHEGVLERLGQEISLRDYNMYVVHHGRMLLSFGQIKACTPRDKDFVYGSLKPIPVQTLHSFKVPDSYHYRRRIHLYDTAARAQSEPCGVDTSDLGVNIESWFGDEAAATLLGYAEKEVMGHKISEPKAVDGLYVDVGTQTHSFRSAPFNSKTTLAEVMAERPLKLHLQLQAESVNSRHSRASCVFAFLCGHTFHRREFATHFRNVHSDIQTCLSGWFEQRCPLAYLGCTYSQRRFQPSTHEARVTYNQQLRSFNLRLTPVASLGDASQPSRSSADSSTAQGEGGGRPGGGGEDSLSSLPYEVLCHMASFLDSMSLSQLALVSRLMRQVCSTLLQERGMVTLRWERKTYSHRGAKWRAKPVWEFSRLFSSVDSWHMTDTPPISAHLKVCPYYETSVHSEPVPLPGMSEKQRCSQERMSLVDHFNRNRCQQ